MYIYIYVCVYIPGKHSNVLIGVIGYTVYNMRFAVRLLLTTGSLSCLNDLNAST